MTGLERDDNEREPGLEEDRDLVDRLTLLGKALGNPVRVRIAAALLRVDEASPKDLTALLGDQLGNVSYHVRYLDGLGFLHLERLIPRRGAIAHRYSMGGSLRRALPAAAAALGSQDDAVALSGDDVASLSYHLVEVQATEVIAAHGEALARVNNALSDTARTRILGYLLERDQATAGGIAMGMDLSRSTVEEHLLVLAEERMVLSTGQGIRKRWTVNPATSRALAGFKDLLLALQPRAEVSE
jgi:DNA-binding transcriptional ArsR family regulator